MECSHLFCDHRRQRPSTTMSFATVRSFSRALMLGRYRRHSNVPAEPEDLAIWG